MDLKSFDAVDFDPKKWINNAWLHSENKDKETFVTNAISRLHLYKRQLTNSLDETATQIVTSLPRVVNEASSLQTSGILIQQKLLSLEKQVVDVEEETGHSVQSLQKIDLLKAKLESAASSLQEADKWVALASSLEEILDRGVPTDKEKLEEITEKVASMTNSLEVLSEAPDYIAKRQQLDTLYNRLEAAVSAPLLDALTQMDSEKTSSYVRLFHCMRRHTPLARCYRRCLATKMSLDWKARGEINYHMLLTGVEQQMQWLINVMKCDSPLQEILRLYTDVLMALDPSPTKIVLSKLSLIDSPIDGIVYLCDLRSQLDSMKTVFEKLIEERRDIETLPHQVLKDLGRAIYTPLRHTLTKYTDKQSQVFMLYLDDEKVDQEDLLEISRAYQSIVERSENVLKSAHSTAKKLAGSACYPFLVPAVENFASTLCMNISTHTKLINESIQKNKCAGVLSSTFPAALLLNDVVNEFIEILTRFVTDLQGDMVLDETQEPLQSIELLLMDEKLTKSYNNLRNTKDVIPCMVNLKSEGVTLRGIADCVLIGPSKVELDKIPTLNVWSNNDSMVTDLPDYAISPQEYITEIGQYLMTLPQHLEMHLADKHAPLQFLNQVCTKTCDLFAEKMSNVKEMDNLGIRRCLVDIAYLSSVVEDLGSTITPTLKDLEASLRERS